jgi:hypothetical protein
MECAPGALQDLPKRLTGPYGAIPGPPFDRPKADMPKPSIAVTMTAGCYFLVSSIGSTLSGVA